MEASGSIKEKGSLFTGYAVRVSSLAEIRRYRRIKLLHPDADHIVIAYNTPRYQGGHDDGEFGASLRLLKLLDVRGDNKIAVFVARIFGGTLLGSKRFSLLETVVKEALRPVPTERLRLR